MALIFCDSFDIDTTGLKYDALSGITTFGPSFARSGRNGLNLSTPGVGPGMARKNFTSRSTFIVGFALKVIFSSGPDREVFLLQDSSAAQISLSVNSAGILKEIGRASCRERV